MGKKGGSGFVPTPPSPSRNLRINESAYGRPIAIRYGEQRCGMSVLCLFEFTAHEVFSSSGASAQVKKGGGFQPLQTFEYFVDLVADLGEGTEFGDTTTRMHLGRATPGRNIISVDDGIDGRGNAGAKRPQLEAGVEPGCWRGKRVRIVAPKGPVNGWRAMHWFDWGDTSFHHHIAWDDQLVQDSFHNTSDRKHKTRYIQDFNFNYLGLARITIQRLKLGSTASLPQINHAPRLLKQYNDWYGPGADTVPIYDADPAMIMEDLCSNMKHGGGWDRRFDPLRTTPAQVPIDDPRNFLVFLAGYPFPWGAGVGAGDLVGPGLADSWSAYCRANNLLLSPGYENQQPLSEILQELAEITNTSILWSEGLVKMIPNSNKAATSTRTGVTYTPTTDGTVYTTGANIGVRWDLTDDDFLPAKGKDPVELESADRVPDHGSAGQFNMIPLEYEDRRAGYNTAMADPPAIDEASISAYGPLTRDTLTYHSIKEATIARDVAMRELQNTGIVRQKWNFKLGPRHARAEPMDVVTLTETTRGFVKKPVRIKTISRDKNDIMDIVAEDFPEAIEATAPDGPIVDTPVVDVIGDVIPGGIWTFDKGRPIDKTYVSLTGGETSDFYIINIGPATGDGTIFFEPSADAVYFLNTRARRIRKWSVFYTRHEVAQTLSSSNGLGGTTTITRIPARTRLRFYVNDVSRPELELWFNHGDLGTRQVAVGDLLLAERDKVCVEIVHFDASGALFRATTVRSGNNQTDTMAAAKDFNWSIGCEFESLDEDDV